MVFTDNPLLEIVRDSPPIDESSTVLSDCVFRKMAALHRSQYSFKLSLLLPLPVLVQSVLPLHTMTDYLPQINRIASDVDNLRGKTPLT